MTHSHRHGRRALRIGGLAAAILFALPAMAQEAAAPGAPELDAITVTAQRRAENIQDVPMAITTIDREKLEVLTSGGDDIRLLSGRLPSLNIESSFGRAFPRFYIRGLGNTDFDLNASQPVSLVYDGVVQENPILKGFPLFDLDQIEMARGPQGTLFGRNSPAGVIKFESARPEQEFGGHARIGYGKYNTINVEGAVTGGLSETVSARLSVLHERRDDWVDNVANGPGDDLEGYKETAARLQVLFQPSDTFEALANVHMRKLDGGFPLFDLDQIEMARGPQGTLFGRNSPAGVIKFESARPEQEFGGHARIGYGKYNTINVEGAVTGGLSETVSARLSVLHERRDDWVDNVANGPGDDLEGYKETAARLQVLFQPSDTFEALANVHMRKLDGTARLFRAGLIRPGSNEINSGFSRDRVSIDGRNEQTLDQFGANLRMRWDLGRVSLYSITGYESVETFSRGDIDGGSVYAFPTGPIGTSLFPAESADGLPDHRQLSQEFRLESNEWGRFDWQAGLFWFDESIDVDSFSYDGFGGPQNGYAVQRQDNTAWAVFASGDFDVTDKLKLRGGLRYTDDQKDFTAERVVGPFGPPIAPIKVSPSDTDVSWDLSAVYAINDDVNVYGRVARGFRAPSVQGRLMFADATLPSNQLVTVADTETVLSWEAGVKAQLWDNRLRLGFALFRYTVNDQQLTAVGGASNIATLVNADKTIGQGAELDVQAWLTDNLFVTFGASYNDTEIQDKNLTVFGCGGGCQVNDPAGTVAGTFRIDGNSLPQAPKHVYNVTARYGIPTSHGEFFAYTDWAYRSDVNFFLYESTEFTGASLLEGGLRLGYAWNSGDYEVALYGRNITNEEAIVGGIDFNNLTGFLNEPRTWGVEFKAKF